MAVVDFTVSKKRYFIKTLCKYISADFVNWCQKLSFGQTMYVTILPNNVHVPSQQCNHVLVRFFVLHYTSKLFEAEEIFAITTEKRKSIFFEYRQSHSTNIIWHLFSFVAHGVIFKLFFSFGCSSWYVRDLTA